MFNLYFALSIINVQIFSYDHFFLLKNTIFNNDKEKKKKEKEENALYGRNTKQQSI